MTGPENPEAGASSTAETAAAPPERLRAPPEPGRFTPGTLLAGRYRIVTPLGKGGMGEVFRADDIRLGQPVALKFLPAALASDLGRLERLVAEVRIGRQVSHPNVCRLYDIAEAEGHHFLVMEYVDGEDLASLLRRIGRLPGDKALEIARGLCAGLAAAHDKGVVHRDLKPANVMIDGKGQARIADFGLAALTASGSVPGLAGTPAYMAPEQLLGEGASTRSDVFALGLVLYEMFTGRRAFEAKTPDELRALHAQVKPPSLSSGVRDVDPAVERVVLRCLARDPKDRPASARVVQALLPGGDPLEAAVLAGETPSPEMVAAASQVGDLTPAVAWLALGCGIVGLLLATALSGRVSLFRLVPLAKPPEALAERAAQTLTRLGYGTDAADRASAFFVDTAFLEYVARHDRAPTRWQKLRSARPGPFLFFYRQSPEPIVSRSWIPVAPWTGPPELGRITRDEPPLDVPGMAEVVLDTHGRVASFKAVPPRVDTGTGPWSDPDWLPLLTEAGFEPGDLRPSAPRWAAPVDSDRKAAWDWAPSGAPGEPLHLEAAAYHGRIVYFEVQGPWVRSPTSQASGPIGLFAAKVAVFSTSGFVLAAGIVMVRRNMRMGRGDRRGALRLSLFTFATLTLAHCFRADHTSLAFEEYALLVAILSQGCYGAIMCWSYYMALEPAVRRRWPHTLISWTRLLEGRFRDALVGRDLLAGILLGLGVILSTHLAQEAPVWLGRAPEIPGGALSALSSPRHLAWFFLIGPCLALLYSLATLFILYLLHAVVREARVARLLVFAFAFLLAYAGSDDPLVGAVPAAIFGALIVLALTRFGLLSTAALLFTFFLLLRTPLTLDWSAWYAGRAFAVLAFFTAMLLFAFHTALGGKPLFGKALLED